MSKWSLLILLLAGCAAEPEVKQTVCWERIDPLGVLKYADVYEGKTTPNCNQWCVGRVAPRCVCKETCICKRSK